MVRIKKSEKQESSLTIRSQGELTQVNAEVVPYQSGSITKPDAQMMLPPIVKVKLAEIGKRFGVAFSLDNITLDGNMPENIKAFRQIVSMAEGNSKLLPEMLKLIKKLMKAEINLAKFHKGCVDASLKHQEKLDKVTSDIFLRMAGHESGSKIRQLRTNKRAELIQKRTTLQEKYYVESVFGSESQLLDAHYETLAHNKRVSTDSRLKRKSFNQAERDKLRAYVDSAYE